MGKFDKDQLGDRMKRYEARAASSLVPKVPMLLRLDGRAFHTLTHGLAKPYDLTLGRCMEAAARAVCEDVSGARLAFIQSDEVSVLVIDYQTPTTQGWFDYAVQKVVSVAASVATGAFNAEWSQAYGSVATFDCRAWSLPREEVCNYFIWRQQDAVRNSIQGLAQAHFSHKALHGKNTTELQDMLVLDRGINWNDCPVPQKRGVCLYRETYEAETPTGEPATRHRWVADVQVPIFTQNRNYIEQWLAVEAKEDPK